MCLSPEGSPARSDSTTVSGQPLRGVWVWHAVEVCALRMTQLGQAAGIARRRPGTRNVVEPLSHKMSVSPPVCLDDDDDDVAPSESIIS